MISNATLFYGLQVITDKPDDDTYCFLSDNLSSCHLDVDFDMYGSWEQGYEQEFYYLYTRKFETAHATVALTIPSELLVIDPFWDKRLEKACEKLGLAYQKPGWHLCGFYGDYSSHGEPSPG